MFDNKTISALYISLLFIISLSAYSFDININEDIEYIDVFHNGNKVRIMRNQDTFNTMNPEYTITSRKCPPFCIQPIIIAEGVETIGEIELLEYLKRRSQGDKSILVIDSRTPDWVVKGTIPGSVNIPWTRLKQSAGADPFTIGEILENEFNVKTQEGLWDFTKAKLLVLFCNGSWCGQSPSNIRTLLKFGYPAHKIKWYRGGMQSWESLGLTVVK